MVLDCQSSSRVWYLPESSTPSDCDSRPILIRIVSFIVCPRHQADGRASPAGAGRCRGKYGLSAETAGVGAATVCGWTAATGRVDCWRRSIYIRNQTGDGRSGARRRSSWCWWSGRPATGALNNAASAPVASPMTRPSVYLSRGTRRRPFYEFAGVPPDRRTTSGGRRQVVRRGEAQRRGGELLVDRSK